MVGKVSAVLFLVTLLTGCVKEDPTAKAAQDAEDIAMVERMSREPFRPIIPSPITATDITRYGLDRPGCSFRKTGDPHILFFGDGTDGFLRIGEDLGRYAAKTESAELPGGARSTYVGLATWLDIVRLPEDGTGGDALGWPARLILHDAQERVAFTAHGRITCKAAPNLADTGS